MPDQPVAQGDPDPYAEGPAFEVSLPGAIDALLARAEAAEAKLNAIGLLLDVDAEHTGWDRIRELKAQLAQAREALREMTRLLDEEANGSDIPNPVRNAWDDYYKDTPGTVPPPVSIYDMAACIAQDKAWELGLAALARLEQGDKDAS